jgi:hypothetical protein
LQGNVFTPVEFPGAQETVVNGVSSSTVIGYYINYDDGIPHGFIYDGSTFKTVDCPWGGYNSLTGVSGVTVVGTYYGENISTNLDVAYRSFIYDGSTFTKLNVPGSFQTRALGISGGTIVGWYQDSASVGHGFVYNGSTFTTLDFPGASSTQLLSISGGTIAGTSSITNPPYFQPFAYDGSTFLTLDLPDWSALPSPTITGISGGTIVGYYQPGPGIVFRGFVYDGSALTTIDFPGTSMTGLLGVSGNTVFGTTYLGGKGFVAQLQVPGLLMSLTTSNSLVISWPYPSTGWTLQQNSDLATTNWVAPPQTITSDGASSFIIATRPSGNLFFRLGH